MVAKVIWCLVLQNIEEHNLRLLLFKIKPFSSYILLTESFFTDKKKKKKILHSNALHLN